MDTPCPTCHLTVLSGRHGQRRRQLVRQIYAIERQILCLENGALYDTIERQAAAPACTLCGQAAPGKPGQPTTVSDSVRPLLARRDQLLRELNRLDRQG